jgi:hypothetical protein
MADVTDFTAPMSDTREVAVGPVWVEVGYIATTGRWWIRSGSSDGPMAGFEVNVTDEGVVVLDIRSEDDDEVVATVFDPSDADDVFPAEDEE